MVVVAKWRSLTMYMVLTMYGDDHTRANYNCDGFQKGCCASNWRFNMLGEKSLHVTPLLREKSTGASPPRCLWLLPLRVRARARARERPRLRKRVRPPPRFVMRRVGVTEWARERGRCLLERARVFAGIRLRICTLITLYYREENKNEFKK